MDGDTDSPPRRSHPPTRKLPSRQAKIKQPARETRATAAYFTSSSNAQRSSSETDYQPGVSTRRNLRSNSSSAKSAKRRRIQPPVRRHPGPHPRHRHAPLKPTNDVSSENPLIFPPWHSLPYHVWLSVFDSIAAPVRDHDSRFDDVETAQRTLVAAARTCRATAEPALAALYKHIPFHRDYLKNPIISFTQFLQTLALPPSETTIRYRPKVETLRIDVECVLSRKVSGVQLTLSHALKYLPRLACLELCHQADNPPYRDLGLHGRWKLSKSDLLEGLGAFPLKDASVGDKTTLTTLRSWRWNNRFETDDVSLRHLAEIHMLPSFRSLRKVAYVNYQPPSTTQFPARARESNEARERDLQAIAHFVASVSALPQLEHLVIESSDLANGLLLEGLPKSLVRLELLNCCEITSEDLANFLVSHGNSLVHLTLKHCQSLSLGFLPVLGTSCPNLAHLEVDLTYFRNHEFYADNKPEYATLLAVDQVPSWPSSIQSIEIIPMRHWTREAADMFFDSLMKNARDLPNLRRLEFKVILNVDWRQRQEMRQSLADQMTRIFKRKSPPPKELKSLRRHNETKPQDVSTAESSKPTTRRSSRIADQSSALASKKHDTLATTSRGIGKAALVHRGLRPSQSISRFDADDEDSDEDEICMGYVPARRSKGRVATTKVAHSQSDEFIHGLCDVVNIQVDNQRPAEQQFDMDDFLDSANSSDPEWNSIADDIVQYQ